MTFTSMIISNSHIKRIGSFPTEDDTPLLVDTETPESGKTSTELFEVIARWNPQEAQAWRGVKLVEQSLRPGM